MEQPCSFSFIFCESPFTGSSIHIYALKVDRDDRPCAYGSALPKATSGMKERPDPAIRIFDQVPLT